MSAAGSKADPPRVMLSSPLMTDADMVMAIRYMSVSR
jgi:hypothetical protein